MNRLDSEKGYVVCVKNDGYSASLEVRKIYQTVPDPAGSEKGLIRVVDESGEDFLYPRDYFIRIDLPESAAKAFSPAR